MTHDFTYDNLKAYSESLGYVLSDADCDEIIRTSHNGETVQEAVNDYLDAYER